MIHLHSDVFHFKVVLDPDSISPFDPSWISSNSQLRVEYCVAGGVSVALVTGIQSCQAVVRYIHNNSQLPLPTLLAGFSPSPGEEKSGDPEKPKSKEKPELGDPTENNRNTTVLNNIKRSNKIVRRGGDCKKKYVNGQYASSIKLSSANCASLKNGKIDSLNAEVRSTSANIVTLQETHYKQKGKIKMDKSFVIHQNQKRWWHSNCSPRESET